MVQSFLSIKPNRVIGLLVLCFWGAGPALAEGLLEPTPTTLEADSRPRGHNESTAPVGNSVETLMAELTTAEERLDQARAAEGAALKSLRTARKRNYPRGPALQALRQKASRSEVERDAAEQGFLWRVEEARREGLPAGLLSSFLERAEQLESTRAARVSRRSPGNPLSN